MLAEQKAQGGMNTGVRGQLAGKNKDGKPNISGGSNVEPPENSPTLTSLGIDKKLSSRAQGIAAIPESEFEQALAVEDVRQNAPMIECADAIDWDLSTL